LLFAASSCISRSTRAIASKSAGRRVNSIG
jgi:hypothetical protein